MAEVSAVVTFKVPAGMEAEFEKTFAAARVFVKQEPGCLSWDLFKHQKDAGVYFIVERYTDQAAFDAHVANPALKEFGPSLRPAMTERTVVIGDGKQ